MVLAGLRWICAWGAFGFFGASAQAASFNCQGARSPDERAVCADRHLNDQDVVLAMLVRTLAQMQGGKANAGKANKELRATQRDWLVKRKACRADRQCLTHHYDDRIAALEEQYQRL